MREHKDDQVNRLSRRYDYRHGHICGTCISTSRAEEQKLYITEAAPGELPRCSKIAALERRNSNSAWLYSVPAFAPSGAAL